MPYLKGGVDGPGPYSLVNLLSLIIMPLSLWWIKVPEHTKKVIYWEGSNKGYSCFTGGFHHSGLPGVPVNVWTTGLQWAECTYFLKPFDSFLTKDSWELF